MKKKTKKKAKKNDPILIITFILYYSDNFVE